MTPALRYYRQADLAERERSRNRKMPRQSKPKSFTVDEANASLSILNSVFEEMDNRKNELFKLREQVQILEVMWGDQLAAASNPDRAAYDRHIANGQTAVEDLNRFVSQQIIDRGMRFPPGGLDQGLIDFPTTFDGRWVFMCWQRGEPIVSFWHELDGGYAGRQEIQAEHIIRMGADDAEDDARLDF